MAELFAGLDVSQATTSICIVERSGKVLAETVAATEMTAISAALKPFKARLGKVGHESGHLSPWLHKELLKRKFKAVCLDARQTRAAMAAQRNKTDRNDARAIAVLLSRGFDGQAHVKTIEAQRLQTLVLFRNTLTRRARDIDRVLGANLKIYGAKLNRSSGKVTLVWPPRGKDHTLIAHAQHMLDARNAVVAEAEALELAIKAFAKADPICRRFMTVPGVGPLSAATFRSAVDDPHRFRSSRNVAAYFGLTPRRVQSGRSDFQRAISRAGSVEVRAILFQAAHNLLVHSKKESALRTWGLKLAKVRGLRHARVACSRKIAVILHSMWIHELDFVPAGTQALVRSHAQAARIGKTQLKSGTSLPDRKRSRRADD